MSTPPRFKVYPDMPHDAIVICAFARDSAFADDVRATCSRCPAAIVHRPHVTTGTKLCPRCGVAHVLQSRATSFGMTRQTADDLRLYFTAKGAKQ